jgi:hypothetical protein
MTMPELLTTVRAAGIHLKARGSRLHVDAPRGVITPELRDALARHKAEILTALAPSRRFVTLFPDMRTGFAPTVPVEAIEFATDLAFRGFQQTVNSDGEYRVAPSGNLSDRDRAAIARWRRHLAALVTYVPPQPF